MEKFGNLEPIGDQNHASRSGFELLMKGIGRRSRLPREMPNVPTYEVGAELVATWPRRELSVYARKSGEGWVGLLRG